MSEVSQQPVVRYYFVDEAGDPILFNKTKRVVVGDAGCSSYFILGKVDVEQPMAVAAGLESLRLQLLADPYFKGVPSMQPEQK